MASCECDSAVATVAIVQSPHGAEGRQAAVERTKLASQREHLPIHSFPMNLDADLVPDVAHGKLDAEGERRGEVASVVPRDRSGA